MFKISEDENTITYKEKNKLISRYNLLRLKVRDYADKNPYLEEYMSNNYSYYYLTKESFEKLTNDISYLENFLETVEDKDEDDIGYSFNSLLVGKYDMFNQMSSYRYNSDDEDMYNVVSEPRRSGRKRKKRTFDDMVDSSELTESDFVNVKRDSEIRKPSKKRQKVSKPKISKKKVNNTKKENTNVKKPGIDAEEDLTKFLRELGPLNKGNLENIRNNLWKDLLICLKIIIEFLLQII